MLRDAPNKTKLQDLPPKNKAWIGILNVDTGKVLVRRLFLADSFWRRLLGLIPHREICAGEGLLLTPCKGIHTFFMRYDIDVLYLDKDMCVVASFPEVKPWRVLPQLSAAVQVLEMATGTLSASRTRVGHKLMFCSCSVTDEE